MNKGDYTNIIVHDQTDSSKQSQDNISPENENLSNDELPPLEPNDDNMVFSIQDDDKHKMASTLGIAYDYIKVKSEVVEISSTNNPKKTPKRKIASISNETSIRDETSVSQNNDTRLDQDESQPNQNELRNTINETIPSIQLSVNEDISQTKILYDAVLTLHPEFKLDFAKKFLNTIDEKSVRTSLRRRIELSQKNYIPPISNLTINQYKALGINNPPSVFLMKNSMSFKRM